MFTSTRCFWYCCNEKQSSGASLQKMCSYKFRGMWEKWDPGPGNRDSLSIPGTWYPGPYISDPIQSKKTHDYKTLEPSLQILKVFGTDGEVNVYRSMQASFSSAKRLICSIYAKENIVKKWASLGIEQEIYINEIFGVKVGKRKIKGLLKKIFKNNVKIWIRSER